MSRKRTSEVLELAKKADMILSSQVESGLNKIIYKEFNTTVSNLKTSTNVFYPYVVITDVGKEGMFKLDSTDTTSVNDDMYIIVDAANGRWKRTSDVVNTKLAYVTTKTALQAYTQSTLAYFDGSTWEKKNGNIASNGGTSPGTIINVSSSFYWSRILKNNIIEGDWFGIKADGITDDLVTGKNAFLALQEGQTLLLPSGIIYITGTDNILTDGFNITQSNVTIKGTGNTTIKQNTNSFYCLSINGNNGGTSSVTTNIRNVKIQDIAFLGTVVIDGFSEFRHNLNAHAVTDLLIENCTFTAFRGDGILIGSSNTAGVERHNKNVKIVNCKFDGINKDNRNAISVIDCDGLEISGCTFKNTTKATMPGAIDIEPDAQIFHYINNIFIHHNILENIGGNLGVIAYFGTNVLTNQINSLNISDNEIKNCTGTGGGISVMTRIIHSNTSLSNNVKISKNTVIGCERPLQVAGVKSGKITNNTFEKCNKPIEIGSTTTGTDNYQISFTGNTVSKVGLTLSSNGLNIFTCYDLRILNNDFVDNYGYAVDFQLGNSTNVNIQNNTFLNFSGNTTQAILKEANHTTTPSANTIFNNITNGLGVYLPAFKTDIDQTTNVYDLSVLPSTFPTGQSKTIINGISGLPDSYTQGILITDRNTITAGYTGWVTQYFYPRSDATVFYIRKSAGTDNTWTTFKKFTGI